MAFIVKGGTNLISKKDMKKVMDNIHEKKDPMEGLSEQKKELRQEVLSAKRHRVYETCCR